MKNFGTLNGAFGDVVSDLQASADADTQAGLAALQLFYQAALPLNTQLPQDFPSFLLGLEQALCPQTEASRWPGYVGPLYPNNTDAVFKLKVAGIGTMINNGGTSSSGFFSTLFNTQAPATAMSQDQVQAAMQALASQGGGKIPTDFNAFAAVLTNSATQVNFVSALWYTATASAANIVQGAQAAGNAVIATGEGALNALNIFAQYEPYFIAAGLALAGYVGYKLYLKPMSSRIAKNPHRKLRKIKTRRGSLNLCPSCSRGHPPNKHISHVYRGANGCECAHKSHTKKKKNPCMTGVDGSEVCF